MNVSSAALMRAGRREQNCKSSERWFLVPLSHMSVPAFSSGESELLALSAKGRLMTCGLCSPDDTQPIKMNPDKAGQRIKELLSGIGHVSERSDLSSFCHSPHTHPAMQKIIVIQPPCNAWFCLTLTGFLCLNNWALEIWWQYLMKAKISLR